MTSIDTESKFATFGLLWMARALSLFGIVVMALFMIGEGFNPLAFDGKELVLALFFPLGVIAGMVLAWWKEGLGGLVAILSLAGFYLAHFIISGGWPRGLAFLAFASPGALFLTYWLLKRTVHY